MSVPYPVKYSRACKLQELKSADSEQPGHVYRDVRNAVLDFVSIHAPSRDATQDNAATGIDSIMNSAGLASFRQVVCSALCRELQNIMAMA